MTITTLSRRELNQDVSRARKVSRSGPVIIADRGKPAHVLLSIARGFCWCTSLRTTACSQSAQRA
ncbi:hypothetical protein [Paludibacterium yongneupense]|uniref:hypothetical protein n=1 Tax=Paludibacterium yongneupense TaxID=400061 RepID=UPI001FE5337B|nr:hypothetical protein [Paludibacterium yongneupense]